MDSRRLCPLVAGELFLRGSSEGAREAEGPFFAALRFGWSSRSLVGRLTPFAVVKHFPRVGPAPRTILTTRGVRSSNNDSWHPGTV